MKITDDWREKSDIRLLSPGRHFAAPEPATSNKIASRTMLVAILAAGTGLATVDRFHTGRPLPSLPYHKGNSPAAPAGDVAPTMRRSQHRDVSVPPNIPAPTVGFHAEAVARGPIHRPDLSDGAEPHRTIPSGKSDRSIESPKIVEDRFPVAKIAAPYRIDISKLDNGIDATGNVSSGSAPKGVQTIRADAISLAEQIRAEALAEVTGSQYDPAMPVGDNGENENAVASADAIAPAPASPAVDPVSVDLRDDSASLSTTDNKRGQPNDRDPMASSSEGEPMDRSGTGEGGEPLRSTAASPDRSVDGAKPAVSLGDNPTTISGDRGIADGAFPAAALEGRPDGIQFNVTTVINDAPAGNLPIIIGGALDDHPEQIAKGFYIRLSDILTLFRSRMDRGVFDKMMASQDAGKYISFGSLRSYGISVAFDRRDRLIIKST